MLSSRSCLQMSIERWKPSLTRGSFATQCLKTVVSKMGIDIEVAYYENSNDGVMTKVAEWLINAKNVPLSETFKTNQLLSQKFQEVSEDVTIRCYAGDIAGKEISLAEKPDQVEYVIDAVRSNVKPVIILCKEPIKRRSSEDSLSLVGYTGRTASGMVKEMLNLRSSHCLSSADSDADSAVYCLSEDTPGRDSVFEIADSFILDEASAVSIRRKGKHPTMPTFTVTGGRVPSEMYRIQDQLVFLNEHVLTISDGEAESDDESAHSLPPSFLASSRDSLGSESTSSGTSNSTSGESRSPPPNTSPVGKDEKTGKSTTMKPAPAKKGLERGYATLRPARNKSKAKPPSVSGSRFPFFRKKKNSEPSIMNISPPSPTSPSSPHDSPSKLSRNRQSRSAFRKERGSRRITKKEQPTIPESSYSFQIKTVNVVFCGSSKMEIPCREFNTVMELKDAIAKQLNIKNPDRYTPWKPSDLVLSYATKNCKVYELYSDWQFIFSTALYQIWVEQQGTDMPINVDVVCRGKEEDLRVIHRISNLVGVLLDEKVKSLTGVDISSLRKISSSDRKEAQWARRTLNDYVDMVTMKRDPEEYALSMELVTASTSTILALKIPIDSKIKVVFHYRQCFSLVKQVKVQRTADGVLREVFPCLVACGLVENRIDTYTMQISGEKSYVAGNNELIAFKDIRRCITKGEPVHLSVTEKPNMEEDKPCHLNWLAIDPMSGSAPLHTDITHNIRRDCEVQALSVWDRSDYFSLTIMEASNLPLLPSRSANVFIEAKLYHGEKQLCPTVSTTSKAIDLSVKWKEKLTFKIEKKNIPKAAKILIQISEPYTRRESVAVKRGSKFIYWGLSTVYDHERMMHNGEKIMSLWKGKKDDKRDKEEKKDKVFDEYHEPNPSGPALNNSCPKAVKLKIKFEEYGYPMYYPCSRSQSWSVLQCHQEATSAAVRKPFQKLVDFIRDGKLHSALPAYLSKANWGSLGETLEVYSMLNQIADAEGFPVEIALKLFDCDFPDENIRGFATRVLQQLPDEKLEDFLLQLTQALKFELNHDSELARFLLGRALRNKRIGHFFFWYLKCEMYNLQYMTRFGVILEAYLKGCGEAMLKQFEHQVEMQKTLEEIASELKQKCNDEHSKMQAMLPEMLEMYGVPHFELTPVYNPRISLGSLRPTKCKIMASKKKPQWLEMYNVDPTALTQTPTRLIVKMGDDLRQDMITLRMFSLFEKLWEEDGLDLALIPYGCVATGPDSGFIEVIKNARTIAEVSGVNNQTKLLDWIKSHQKNEFGETDSDMVKEAVRTFVHSCAGYSVATYVLGIGDRHNDNIMVTTSGNLCHIDFGHFLGNIKYIMGFKREWAPFVLTPDFVYVMGGEDSSTFEVYKNLCCRAFLTLRRHAELIINLFSLMRCTGIPELTCVEDTDYIRNALVLEKNEHEAEQSFRKVIKKCLDLKWTVQVMWKFHLLRKRSN